MSALFKYDLEMHEQMLNFGSQNTSKGGSGAIFGAQGLHLAAQGLQIHHIAVYAAYGCWLAGHWDPPWSTVQRQVVVNRTILGP